METESILWSKHVIILVILNFKLILAILRHHRATMSNPPKHKILIVVVGCDSRPGTFTFF
jgi:hypothetical protein